MSVSIYANTLVALHSILSERKWKALSTYVYDVMNEQDTSKGEQFFMDLPQIIAALMEVAATSPSDNNAGQWVRTLRGSGGMKNHPLAGSMGPGVSDSYTYSLLMMQNVASCAEIDIMPTVVRKTDSPEMEILYQAQLRNLIRSSYAIREAYSKQPLPTALMSEDFV